MRLDSSTVSRFPVSLWGAVKGRLRASLRTDCLPTFSVPAVNGGRPALSRRVHCQRGCRSAPNEHNVALSAMGLNGPPRLTNIMSAPPTQGRCAATSTKVSG
ncbi:hypothetical protein CKY02_17485 [Photorhabdus bodei]|uniref:Uncharacterized protein n=1 Tax=Photorhabdus bodei TaxID=2029681 RepID=A0A329X104_9GAMM|nr:hypothetical protein CKY02_17485 [Photorhabdus bodei]